MALPAIPVSQTPEEKYREYLTTLPRPQRYTGQQRDMVKHIFEKHSHFDADGLLDELKAAGLQVSRATVYRTLSKLVDAGLLRRLEIGERTFYDHDYGYPQHDHLVCEECGKMIEFQHESIDAVLKEIAGQHLFQVLGHNLIVRGMCVDCNRARSSKRRLDVI